VRGNFSHIRLFCNFCFVPCRAAVPDFRTASTNLITNFAKSWLHTWHAWGRTMQLCPTYQCCVPLQVAPIMVPFPRRGPVLPSCHWSLGCAWKMQRGRIELKKTHSLTDRARNVSYAPPKLPCHLIAIGGGVETKMKGQWGVHWRRSRHFSCTFSALDISGVKMMKLWCEIGREIQPKSSHVFPTLAQYFMNFQSWKLIRYLLMLLDPL